MSFEEEHGLGRNVQPRKERMKKIHTTASSSNLLGRMISAKHEGNKKTAMKKALKNKQK